MTKLNTGGPAFPVDEKNSDGTHYHTNFGMTLRDYFAAKELAKTNAVAILDVPEAYDRLAVHCYRMADAMLKARKS